MPDGIREEHARLLRYESNVYGAVCGPEFLLGLGIFVLQLIRSDGAGRLPRDPFRCAHRIVGSGYGDVCDCVGSVPQDHGMRLQAHRGRARGRFARFLCGNRALHVSGAGGKRCPVGARCGDIGPYVLGNRSGLGRCLSRSGCSKRRSVYFDDVFRRGYPVLCRFAYESSCFVRRRIAVSGARRVVAGLQPG